MLLSYSVLFLDFTVDVISSWLCNFLNAACYTARDARFAASVFQARCLAAIKPIAECVVIAFLSLMITSLLQVVNRLDAS